jgi:hypothetical protein
MNLHYLPTEVISSIDVVNLPPVKSRTETVGSVSLHIYAGDALDRSSMRQAQYDIVYSNSVIEYVGSLRSQRNMAAVIQDLGHHYWVQTPAKSFPLEPHFYLPFFPYLPLSVRTLLHTRYDLGFMKKNENWLEARIDCEETRLLTRAELQSIFVGCQILEEKMLGLCKSYIATNMVIR